MRCRSQICHQNSNKRGTGMNSAKEIAIKAFWAGLPGIYGVDECLCEAIDAYDKAKAPRTISVEEFERFADAIRFMPNVWEKDADNTAKVALATLGIKVEK